MKLLKKILGKKEQAIVSPDDFWNWFLENEKIFFDVVNNQDDIEANFLNKLSPKLDELREGYWFLTGMFDDDTAELILTADGVIKNIVFIEEIVAAAPQIDGWKFTALKPSSDIENVNIHMADVVFSKDNLSFYSNEDPDYPDEIDISIIHDDYSEENHEAITTGCFIFIDNYLGELDFATTIDNVDFVEKDQITKELVPIEKLKNFLIWREKEFIEKYSGIRYNTEDDGYASLEATLENGMPLLAIVNSTLLEWDKKASHPWVLNIQIKYEGYESGMPDEETYALMNEMEDKIMALLPDSEGCLNIARETANHEREIYFACKDFRMPAKVLDQMQSEYVGRLNIEFDIYKDKYWRSFNKYDPPPQY